MSRRHKNSAFCLIFGDNKKAILALHNAIHKTTFRLEESEIYINTLEESLWTAQRNDLSYIINGQLVVMVEHQSTVNENMPLRFLQMICRIYENLIKNKEELYRKCLIKLSRPIFVVLYNGTAYFPEYDELFLSDAFMDIEGFDEINLELKVAVYNINDGMNAEIVNACEELRGYVYFVSRVRHYIEQEKAETNSAVRSAIKDCVKSEMLADFFVNLTMEDEIMLVAEWDLDTALKVRGEEMFEEGEKKVSKEIIDFINRGYTTEDLMREFSTRVND